MKFLKVALVIAMALSLTASVYAETQSVKVSGDLTVRGIWRSDYELRGSAPETPDVILSPVNRTGRTADTGVLYGPNQSWFMSTTEVQVDAALTDNVATVIRLVNERDWNVNAKSFAPNADIRMNGYAFQSGLAGNGYTANANDFQVGVDLAYVTLKNFVYCPLTVTIGRQDLWFGKGFIVGSNQVYNNYSNGRLQAPEYTAYTAFDSVKATLDYDPWTITAIYSKISENATADFDDIDLYGVNVGYKFDCYKAEAEAYWFWKQDRSIPQWNGSTNNDIHTLGIRGSADPINDVTLAAEGAYQFGKYTGSVDQNNWSLILPAGADRTNYDASMDRSAWAFDVSGEYRGLMEKMCWKPKLGLEYVFYSGEQTDSNNNNSTGVYRGWDPMFRGKYDSAIREFMGTYYTSYDYAPQAQGIPSSPDASFTNQNQFIFSGSLQPMDSVTLKGNANLFWLNEPILATYDGNPANNTWNKGYIGTEFDGQIIWDYTEDVSFGLLAAWFVPNYDVYQNASATASDVVATCKVSF